MYVNKKQENLLMRTKENLDSRGNSVEKTASFSLKIIFIRSKNIFIRVRECAIWCVVCKEPPDGVRDSWGWGVGHPHLEWAEVV